MKFKIPLLATSALLFYFIILILAYFNFIPNNQEVFLFIARLYESYWIFGLIFASLLEGLVYIGLYFPGSTIIVISVFLSDGNYLRFFWISFIVAVVFTFTSLINYALGFVFSKKESNNFNSGFLLSCLYPNALSFYFFNRGLNRRGLKLILLVFPVIFVWGFILCLLFYFLKSFITNNAEIPFVILVALFCWFLISFYLKNKK